MTRFAPLLLLLVFGFGVSDARSAPAQGVDVDLEQVFSDPLFSRWEVRQARREAPIPDGLIPEWDFGFTEALESLWDGVRNLWNQMFPPSSAPPPVRAPSGGGSGPNLVEVLKVAGIIMAIVLGIVVIVLLVAAGRSFVRSRGSGSAVPIAEALKSGDALAASADDWLEHAGSLAEEDDLRLAYRAVYLALLAGLHERGSITFDTRRTNWTYVRQFKGEAADRNRFDLLTGGFDSSWYGLHLPTRGEFDRMRSMTRELLAEEGS